MPEPVPSTQGANPGRDVTVEWLDRPVVAHQAGDTVPPPRAMPSVPAARPTVHRRRELIRPYYGPDFRWLGVRAGHPQHIIQVGAHGRPFEHPSPPGPPRVLPDPWWAQGEQAPPPTTIAQD